MNALVASFSGAHRRDGRAMFATVCGLALVVVARLANIVDGAVLVPLLLAGTWVAGRLLWQRRGGGRRPQAAHEQDFAALCSTARIGLWRQYNNSRVVEISPVLRDLLGVATLRPTEQDALALLHPDDRIQVAALHRQVRLLLQPAAQEVRVVHPRHGLRHLRWELRPQTDPQGRFAGITASVQDITEWRLAEERRRQASRMDALGQLAAGLAHDFNNLLCTVVLNLEMLDPIVARAAAPPAATPPAATREVRAGDLVRRARAAAERGADLTAQLLAFSGKHPAQRQPLDIAGAAREAAAAAAAAPARGVSVAMEVGGPTPNAVLADAVPMVVEADPMLLRSAVQTLIAHAVQASPDGGEVRVALATARLDAAAARALGVPPGRYASLTVADQGEGMAPDLLPRLFEPFFRASPDGTDPSASGVGMAMVHGFARGSGGTVGLETGPAGGTVARLLLPLAAESVARALGDPAPGNRAASLGASLGASAALAGGALAGLRVLLVEDDPEVRETTELLLQDDGALVTSAGDAPAAFALLESNLPFDLLLSDVVLPGGLSGIDVVEAAGNIRPGLPALLASGYAAPAQELGRPLPSGVILLRKPYRHADLLNAIAATLPPATRRDAA